MSEKDKRTLFYGTIIIVVYLGLFYGRTLLGALEGSREAYFEKFDEARDLGALFQSYETRVMKVEKLRDQFHLNVHDLNATNLVGQAGRAIQDVVKQSGFKMGQIREVAGRGALGTAATLQLEGTGPMKSFMGLMHRFQSTGYPIILDSFSIRRDLRKPGQLQWSAEVIILDYQRWKTKGGNRG